VLGVGFMELVVIAFVAVVVFGPDKLPELAKQAGQWLRVARRFALQARDDLRSELGPEYADLELRDLDPRTIVRKHIVEAMNDVDDEDRDDDRPKRRKQPTPLAEGEVPPYDVEAT